MSGGSFDYLCFDEDARDLIENLEGLEQMADRLNELPWAVSVATETQRVLNTARRFDAYVRSLTELREAWRAIEWWDSCDWSEEQARAAVRAYEEAVPDVRL